MGFSLKVFFKITVLQFKFCCSDDNFKIYINLTTEGNETNIFINKKI